MIRVMGCFGYGIGEVIFRIGDIDINTKDVRLGLAAY
jgi:hypothetical protein